MPDDRLPPKKTKYAPAATSTPPAMNAMVLVDASH
jgi:hypothetical protein